VRVFFAFFVVKHGYVYKNKQCCINLTNILTWFIAGIGGCEGGVRDGLIVLVCGLLINWCDLGCSDKK